MTDLENKEYRVSVSSLTCTLGQAQTGIQCRFGISQFGGVWGSAHASGPAVVLIWKSYVKDGQVLSVRWTAGIFINRNNYYRKCYGCA